MSGGLPHLRERLCLPGLLSVALLGVPVRKSARRHQSTSPRCHVDRDLRVLFRLLGPLAQLVVLPSCRLLELAHLRRRLLRRALALFLRLSRCRLELP